MHRKWALLAVLLAAALLLLPACGSKEQGEKENEQAVTVAAVEKRDVARNVKYTGMLRGGNEVVISPKVSARTTGIYVKPGDTVSQGQTLLTLDTADFEASLKIAQAGVAAAEAGKRSAEAQLEQARLAYERAKALYDSGALSKQALEQAQTSYEILAAGSADAALASARANLEQAQNNLNHCILTSPINGVVGNILLSLGENSVIGSPAVIVTDASQLELEVLVNEGEVSYISQGQTVDLLVKAAYNQPIKGTVSGVATVPDPQKLNYTVKISLPNQDGRLKSGMVAEVSIDTENKKEALAVPVNAVIAKSGRTIAYVLDENNRAREVEVEIGIKNDSYAEIIKGLSPGQMIIVKGNTLVHDGALVKVITGGAS